LSQRQSARGRVREHVAADTSRARTAASVLVLACIVSVLFAVRASASPDATQSGGGAAARVVHELESDRTGLRTPVGLAISSSSDSFYVLQAGGGASLDADVVRLQPFAASSVSDRAGAARIAAAVRDPVNVAFDSRRSRLLLLDNADRLL